MAVGARPQGGWPPGPTASTPGFETAATVVQRLAVLLEAGVAPPSAWQHAASGVDSPVAAAVAAGIVERGAVGRDLVEHLLAARALAVPGEQQAWAALAAAWLVATESGAPLGPTLRRFAEVLRSLAQARRDVEVALAGPVATARIVLALPAVGLLFGMLLGFDALRIVTTTPAGWACLVVGSLLVLGGIRWNRRLIRAARVLDATPGLGLELLAIAVAGGASLDRAQALVDRMLVEADLPPLDDGAEQVMAFSRAAGVPAAALLHAEAEECRRVAQAAGQRRAVELGIRLLLPLGVCILPAFIALGVAPIVLSIVSSTAAAI
ncbi:MAG: type II secretion system F family protein [Pseudolysinimonas sp.]